MFDKTVNDELNKKLNPKNVSSRGTGKNELSYVQGWHVIAEMNRIFGFGGWMSETVYCKQVCKYDTVIGKGKSWQAEGFTVGYEAKVRVTVGDVVREGTGLGSGIAKDLFDCYEGAAKEAETDAFKRACMKFGNVFGLALYDKEQKNVGVEIDRRTWFANTIESAKTRDKLIEWFGRDDIKDGLEGLDSIDQAIVTALYEDKKGKLSEA